MKWSIVQIWFTSKRKLNYRDRPDQVRFLTKARQNNDVTDRTREVYSKIENKLYDRLDQRRQQRDRLY